MENSITAADLQDVTEIVFASHNRWKIEEFRQVFAELGLRLKIISAADLELPEPDETGSTFVENACLKARAAAQASRLVTIGDDSGFCVSALDGAPGLYSARWGKDGPQKVLEAIGKNINRAAHFMCVPALALPDGRAISIEMPMHGTIPDQPSGDEKFGYGCIFVPTGENRTYAELSTEEQYACNSRIAAFKRLLSHYFEAHIQKPDR